MHLLLQHNCTSLTWCPWCAHHGHALVEDVAGGVSSLWEWRNSLALTRAAFSGNEIHWERVASLAAARAMNSTDASPDRRRSDHDNERYASPGQEGNSNSQQSVNGSISSKDSGSVSDQWLHVTTAPFVSNCVAHIIHIFSLSRRGLRFHFIQSSIFKKYNTNARNDYHFSVPDARNVGELVNRDQGIHFRSPLRNNHKQTIAEGMESQSFASVSILSSSWAPEKCFLPTGKLCSSANKIHVSSTRSTNVSLSLSSFHDGSHTSFG